LFTITWLILGFVSPGFTIWDVTVAPYSPISAGISGLGLGETAPWMNAAFVMSGLLVIACAVGIAGALPDLGSRSRKIIGAVLALVGVGLVIDGVFTLESMMAHFVGFSLAILCAAFGYLLVGRALRRMPDWRDIGTLSLVASPLTIALTLLYFATFSPTAEGARTGIAGLTERILVVEVMLPLVILGWAAFSRRAGLAAR
jgi:hypothetical membrane protein